MMVVTGVHCTVLVLMNCPVSGDTGLGNEATMHDTMRKLRHKAPSAAQPTRGASAAAEGERGDKGSYETVMTKGTPLPHDHGSQFISHTFQHMLETLGIESSP